MNSIRFLENDILKICRYEYKYFLNKPHVVGVGLGYKISNGFSTGKKCIQVFVNKKISKKCLCSNDKVPYMYKGILTDVVKCGCIVASSFTSRMRPAIGGFSISPVVNIQASTMGCLVKEQDNLYILGCNHFLTDENKVPLQSPILQPGSMDGGKVQGDIIATLSKYVPLKFKTLFSTPENYADCAMAKATSSNLVSSRIAVFGTPRGIHAPAVGEVISKAGRTTEVTQGLIKNIGLTVKIKFNRGECLFVNQIATTKMSGLGDSGAILMDEARYAVGMLFATADSYSFYNPIETVLDLLDVNIVTQ